MDIHKSKKLVAEFMELRKTSDFTTSMSGLQVSAEGYLYDNEFYTLDELRYHSDWNWLMEVVEKIESLDRLGGIVTIVQGQCRITSRVAGDHSVYTEKSYYMEKGAQGKLQATYEAVVEFIEWYNEHKN